MKAANPDPTPSGWLDIGRPGHKCQSSIGSLFHYVSGTVLCSTHDESNNPVFRLYNLLPLHIPSSFLWLSCERCISAVLRWDCGNTALQNCPPGNPGSPQLLLELPRLPFTPSCSRFQKRCGPGTRQGGIHGYNPR